MEITLKMNIQDQEFELKANLTMKAGRIYRQQYGRDIIEDMSTLYKVINKSPFDDIDYSQIEVVGKTREEISQQLMEKVDMSKLIVTLEKEEMLTFEETERAGQIIWAFAKNYDEKIPNYEEWVDSYEFLLPVDQIITVIYQAWGKSARPSIELKN